MSIRTYKSTDFKAVLDLLRAHTPRFFAPEEEPEFREYLKEDSEHYFVWEEEGKILAAGGFNTGFEEGRTVRISWDLVHPEAQGRGIGKALTAFRIREIRNIPGVERIRVRTSQLVDQFYAKQGFLEEKRVTNYWAEGFDLVQMVYPL